MRGFLLLFATFVAACVCCEAGTPCPNRDELYPCICTEVEISKKQLFTIVTCRHVPNKKSFDSMFFVLRNMRIDRFIIYDSYWEASNGKDAEQMKLPDNFLSLVMVRELEIRDSELSACFACNIQFGCPNKYIYEISIYNSSSADNVCSTCNGKKVWTGCLRSLKTFTFVGNKLKAIDKSFFAMQMPDMVFANFSNNEITKVGTDAFKNLPRLSTLDLSHNKIESLSDNIFGTEQTAIKYLDLSYNFIKSLQSNIFKYTPHLFTLLATNNRIEKIPFEDWRHLSRQIRIVDLNGNPLHCDCHMIWVNCTTKSHVQFLGFCTNEGFDQTPLRRVSKYVSERCVDGELKQQRNKTLPNGCAELIKKNKETVQLMDLNRVAPNRRDRKSLVTRSP